MTLQEASEELKEEFEIFKDGIDPKHWENPNKELRKIIEANTIAIEVLGQEPCEDCISRQAVKDILDARGAKAIMTFEHFKELLDKLPSITPQPKTGRWIFDEILDKHYYCSECKSMGVDYWDYCPNCGAKMEREDEDADSN